MPTTDIATIIAENSSQELSERWSENIWRSMQENGNCSECDKPCHEVKRMMATALKITWDEYVKQN